MLQPPGARLRAGLRVAPGTSPYSSPIPTLSMRYFLLTVVLGLAACGDPIDPADRAVSVRVLTGTRSVLAGDTLVLVAQALDREGHLVPGVALHWSVTDSGRLEVLDSTAGVFRVLALRGIAHARVTLRSGTSDSVALRVYPRPNVIEAESGDNQVGVMNNALPAGVAARVTAGDGGGVEGVVIAFQVIAGSGTVSRVLQDTDSLGRAAVQWVLGDTGHQALEALTVLPESLSARFTATALTPGVWTWIAGDSTPGALPVYGVRGAAEPSGTPGGRTGATFAVSGDGVWLFGGVNGGVRNDLWHLRDGTWTWVAGSDQPNPAGSFGVQGVPSPSNEPPGRSGAALWVDPNGHVWVFGGNRASGVFRRGADLWRFDGASWTWIAGDSVPEVQPAYGTRGVASSSNSPGGRIPGAYWGDPDGSLWLIGEGFGNAGRGDLWRYNTNGWAWIHGDSARGQFPRYGTLRVPSDANAPGVRVDAVGWFADGAWILGGSGLNASAAEVGTLRDLWRFDGSRWTWMWGTTGGNEAGAYQARGAFTPLNQLGARAGHAVAPDASVVWVFGGVAVGDNGVAGSLNDLWRFDGSQWSWEAGVRRAPAPGRWGTKGIADPANVPSGRVRSALWVGSDGTVWLYGGSGWNDLWRYDLTRLP